MWLFRLLNQICKYILIKCVYVKFQQQIQSHGMWEIRIAERGCTTNMVLEWALRVCSRFAVRPKQWGQKWIACICEILILKKWESIDEIFFPSPHHKRWCKPPPQCINMGGLSSCSGWWIMIAILVSQVMLTMFRMMMMMMMMMVMMMMVVMMILILVLQVIKSSSFHDHYCQRQNHHHHYLNHFQLATLNHYSGKWRCDAIMWF